MKTLKLLTILVVAAISNVSCGRIGPDPDGDPRLYILCLSFVDAEGNDLVYGIELNESDGRRYVAPDQYSLVSSPDVYELGFGPRYGYIPNRYPELVLIPPHNSPAPPYYSVEIALGCSSVDQKLETITYTLTCPHIFGDDDPHEIVSYWTNSTIKHRFYKDNNSQCYQVDIDGREISDIYHLGNYDSGRALVTIALDR
jgi:hypothetical protein